MSGRCYHCHYCHKYEIGIKRTLTFFFNNNRWVSSKRRGRGFANDNDSDTINVSFLPTSYH